MALAAGAIGAAFHLDGMHLRDIPRAFQSGASDLIGAVLVMGMAQGMVLLMGGISPTSASVLNTLLHWAERAFIRIPGVLATGLVYVFQYGFNLVVPSDVGQAALTIPIMAPLADSLGVSRQLAVLAFQLGGSLSHLIMPTSGCLIGVLSIARIPIMAPLADSLGVSRQLAVLAFQLGGSLSHLIMPTSGCLIGVLSIARVEWGDWLRSQWKALAAVFGFGLVAMTIGFFTGYA